MQPASTRLEGTLSAMPLKTLKALWPKAIAPGAREWVGERVHRASILGGKFRFLSGDHMAAGAERRTRRSISCRSLMDAADLEMQVIDDLPPIAAPRAMTRIENDGLEVIIPDASIILAPDRSVPLKDGRFTAVDIMSEVPVGEIAFASQPTLGSVLELLERSPLTILEETGLPREGIDGKVDAKVKIGLPLLAELPASSVKVEAKAKITDGRINKFLGTYQVQSASFDLDVSEKAAGANGQMLVNGVLAKLSWQRIFDAPLDKQPPLRMTATLDNTDRSQLGLDINHIVQGEVPIELTVGRGAGDEQTVRLHADLTNADLILQNVVVAQAAGARPPRCSSISRRARRTRPSCRTSRSPATTSPSRAGRPSTRRTSLREFYFPDFSLNVITRMEVQGTLDKNDIWKVKARGPTFDGRDFFRSLFSLGQLSENAPKPKNPREGIDLEAEIGTVIGHSEVSMRGLKLKLAKRGEKLTALDVRGTLDGSNKPIAVVLRQDPGQPRKLLADSTDAGQAFKMIDFYPNIQGGRVRLEVNLEGKGAAEKTGILWVEDFRILGDPVVSEVFSNADDGRPAIDGAVNRPEQGQARHARGVRVHIHAGAVLGRLRAVRDGAIPQLRGPMLGASIRGKVDFKMRRVNLGGTYVPLQGLNSALCEIPLFGQILTGPKCEGISGMTFAIQGAMDQPRGHRQSAVDAGAGHFPRHLPDDAVRSEGAAARRCGTTGAAGDVDKSVRASSTSAEPTAGTGDDARFRYRSTAGIRRQAPRRRTSSRGVPAGSDRLQQHVLLLAERQLDAAVGGDVGRGEQRLLVDHRLVVDAQAAALNLPARLAVGLDQPRLHERRQHADAACKFRCASSTVGRPSAEAPCSNVCARGLGGRLGLLAPVQQRRRLGRQRLLRLVDLGALQRGELGDLGQRQRRVELQEALDVGVLGVAPELPVVVGGQLLFVEPHGAGGGLAHLGARRCRQQRTGQRVELRRAHARGRDRCR